VLQENTNIYQAVLSRGGYDNQFYLPDNWVGKKPIVYVEHCCLPAAGFDMHQAANWRLEVWPDLQARRDLLAEIESMKPFIFIHPQSPLWPVKSFAVDSIPEIAEFKGNVVNTAERKFGDINEAFLFLWKADMVVTVDSVFMWAAWALNKEIDYLHMHPSDPRVHPLDVHRPLVKRCNAALLPDSAPEYKIDV
jgi:hypothetical protein